MSKLEKLSHTCMIAVAIVALVCMLPTLKSTVWPSSRESPASRMVGRRLPSQELGPQAGKSRVIIAMTSQCPFCMNSMPSFQRISSSIADRGDACDLVVASMSPDVEGVKSLLDSHGVKAAKIVRATGADLNISGTPTVYLVDRAGIVRWAHLGQMTDAKEKELLAELSKLGS
jgi:hypothetical protein